MCFMKKVDSVTPRRLPAADGRLARLDDRDRHRRIDGRAAACDHCATARRGLRAHAGCCANSPHARVSPPFPIDW
jgi:hypothetical protein